MGLVTFEQAPFGVKATERSTVAAALAAEGIEWHPLTYHATPPVLSTAFDALTGFVRGLGLARSRGVRLFHSRGTVPAAPAWAAAGAARRLFFYDADGPLSEEYADAGVWAKDSLPYRLTRGCEGVFARSADRLAVLTSSRAQSLRALLGREVDVVPCAVETSHFVFDPAARARVRDQLGLSGTVLVYAGKWGGWYAVPEMLDFVAVARRALGDIRLLVLTRDPEERFASAAAERSLRDILTVRTATRDEMPGYLSAADVGLSFVTPFPSKTAASPVKNGEYLACGLPIVTTPRIGDYSALVARREVGVVLDDLDAPSFSKACAALPVLLADPGLRSRCREAAVGEVGLQEVVLPRYLRIYESLLGRPEGAQR
jgi:glycosyltransferase involved in cell wall biosynthesis